MTAVEGKKLVHLLDYGTGNIRSVVNAIESVGFEVVRIASPADFASVERLIFPGVGSFGNAVQSLRDQGYWEPLLAYIRSNRPFMGICIGMQVLFESSEESPNVQGLAVLRGRIQRFSDTNKAVPHMGWNKTTVIASDDGQLVNQKGHDVTDYYFVHSFAHLLDTYSAIPDFVYSITKYGDQTFTSAVSCGNIFATQFHPEKSGYAGLAVLKAFLSYTRPSFPSTSVTTLPVVSDHLSKRIIACLDVRSNDAGDLVVTKGDQYDVRERSTDGAVRNLGKPIDLACRYFAEGADEITFLNITSFRQCPLGDLPMMEILRKVSETIFVPLTIGGGIREFAVDQPDGKQLRYSALEVADAYFRSGADKVSIGSDAVYAAEAFWNHLNRQDLATMERVALVHNEPSLVKKAKDTAISLISSKYGRQAVVISVDPKRVYVTNETDTKHATVKTRFPGPSGEKYCWYQCTVKGGREGRDLDVVELVVATELLGAGEILLNCMDRDGTKSGFDDELIRLVKDSVRIPVIASSGAGSSEHFARVFGVGPPGEIVNVESALAAGIFHRREVPLDGVKSYLRQCDIPVRNATAYTVCDTQ